VEYQGQRDIPQSLRVSVDNIRHFQVDPEKALTIASKPAHLDQLSISGTVHRSSLDAASAEHKAQVPSKGLITRNRLWKIKNGKDGS
jgi:hypothetical protein